MIVCTNQVTGRVSVDKDFTDDVNNLFVFEKKVPTVWEDAVEDGWVFERLLIDGLGTDYLGYAIAATKDGKAVPLSGNGSITGGGRVYVGQGFTAIVYTSRSSFEIIVDPKATYEKGCFTACLPINNMYTSAAILTGAKPTYYSVMGDLLFEVYPNDQTLVNYPSFSKAVLDKGRLVGAFGITVGTFGLDVAPKSTVAARKSLLNRWRGSPVERVYDANEGVWLDGFDKNGFMDAITLGLSLQKFRSKIALYSAPTSQAMSEKGLLFFGIAPSEQLVSKHWEEIDSFGMALNSPGGLENAMSALLSVKDESGLRKAMAQFDGCYVDSGKLKQILDGYVIEYERIERQELDRAFKAVENTYQEVNRLITNFERDSLSLGKTLKGDEDLMRQFADFASPVVEMLEGISAVITTRPVFTLTKFSSIGQYSDAVIDMANQTKGWVRVTEGEASDNGAPNLNFEINESGLVDNLRSGVKEKADKLARFVYNLDCALKSNESILKGITEFSVGFKPYYFFQNHDKKETPGVVWHEDETRRYNTMGFDDADFMTGKMFASYATANGYWLNDNGSLTIGSRGEAMRRNTGVREVRVHRFVKNGVMCGSVEITLDVYYVGACSKQLNPSASFETISYEIVRGIISSLEGLEIFQVGNATVSSFGAVNPLNSKGERFSELNNLYGRTRLPITRCHLNIGHRYLGHLDGFWRRVDGSAPHYDGILQAVPAFRYKVNVPMSQDLLGVQLSENSARQPVTDVRAQVNAHVLRLSSFINKEAVKWLVAQLEAYGLLGSVSVVGMSSKSGYVSPETLAHLTSFCMDDAEPFISAFSSVVDMKENGKTTSAFTDDELIAEKARIEKVVQDLNLLVDRSQRKAWYYNGGSPSYIREDLELAGYYLGV